MGLKLRIAAIVAAVGLGVFGWLHPSAKQWPMPAHQPMVPGPGEPLFASEAIFAGRDGISCHVASIVSLDDSSLLAAWYAGSREGAKDVAVFISRRDPLTGIWSKPREVMNRERASRELGLYIRKIGNAVLSRDAHGRLWLFYVSISMGGWSGSALNAMHSEDNGQTWSASRRLHLAPFFNLTNIVKNRPVLMADGSMLIPAYHEFARKFSEGVLFNPYTYKVRKARMTTTGRLIQPGLVVDGQGLIALMRNMKGGYAMRAESTDGGRTWSDVTPTDLPNPNSGLDIIALSDGRLLAAANDIPRGRHQLSLLISADRGMSWKQAAIMEQGHEGSEYSYPFLMRSPDGMIHLAYTHERRQIKHAAFNEAWLLKQEAPR